VIVGVLVLTAINRQMSFTIEQKFCKALGGFFWFPGFHGGNCRCEFEKWS
jgi:hypothetical protein